MNVNAELYFIRHGESYGNIGSNDADTHPDDPKLTDIGLKQAKMLSVHYSQKEISAIYSSALIRACQTMQPTAQKLHMPIRVLRELMEVGTEINNTDPLLAKKYAPNAYASLRSVTAQPVLFDPADGTPEYCEKRAAYCVDTILSAAKDGDRILICTHGGFMGYLLRYCLGLNLPEHFNWQVDNTGIFGIRFTKDKIPKLICANNINHLN